MDLGSNSGLCLRAEAPPDLGRLLESGPALRTVWTVAVWTPDPGETHQAKLGEAGIRDPGRYGVILARRS